MGRGPLGRTRLTTRRSSHEFTRAAPASTPAADSGDHEVDLIVTRGDGRMIALEVKLTAAVDDADGRHLHWLRDHAGGDLLDAAVITTGPAAYRRPDGIAVIPAALLGP